MIGLETISPHFVRMVTEKYTFYFSYAECIAFRVKGKLFCSENKWNNTTGKHINFVEPVRSKRLPYADFIKLLEKLKI
jgi:hypothetical protein